MNESEILYYLFNGGNVRIRYLIKFTNTDSGEVIRLVNDNVSVSYEGEVYQISSFEYKEPDMYGSGASLEIGGIDNDLIPFFENAKDNIRLDVIGQLSAENQVQKIKNYVHFFGSISYGADMKIKYQLGKDDRTEMTFCVYTFDTDNNKGNA